MRFRLIFFLSLALLLPKANGISFNCSLSASCEREAQSMRIEEIKKAILEQLDMVTEPRIPSDKMPSEAMKKLYQDLLDKENGDIPYEAPSKNGIATMFTGTDPSNGGDPSSLVAEFEVDPNRKEFTKARLHVFLRFEDDVTGRRQVDLQVFVKDKDGKKGEELLEDVVTVDEGGYYTITLKEDDMHRLFNEEKIQGFFVDAVYRGRNVAVHPQQTSHEDEQMILELTSVTYNRKRRDASTPICHDNGSPEGCCLRDLIIDFDKIGWDWIIAPNRYNAYYCKGPCATRPHHENGHVKILKAAARVPYYAAQLEGSGSCCHATEYNSLKLIYVNHKSEVSIANINGMIARQCSCS